MSNHKIAFIISVISVCIAFWVNEANLRYLRYNGIALREGQTVQTRDDESYLQPMQTLVETGKLYRTEVEKYGSVIRSPGYGMIYAFFLVIFGAGKSLFYLKIFQVLLFGLSVFCLFFVALWVLKGRGWAVAAALIYGWLPFSMGFLFYTLTESVTPALVVIYVFFLLKAERGSSPRQKHLSYFFAALTFSVLFVIRPFIGILGLALPVFLTSSFYSRRKPLKWMLYMVFYGMLSVSLLLVSQVRNYAVLGRVTGLYPIYQNELPVTFRKTHQAVWNFFKGWESNGARFHETILPLWESAIQGDTAFTNVELAVGKLPDEVTTYFGKDRLNEAFRAYQHSVLISKPYYGQNLPMPSVLPEEEMQVIRIFNEMEKDYKSHFWFTYHIITPLKVLKNMIFHSNLSLYMFQHPLRGKVLTEMLRGLCFGFHVLAFLLGLLFIFFNKSRNHITIFWMCVFLYIFFLAYFQRGIEERYTLPLLPLVIVSALNVVSGLWSRYFPSVRLRNH